MVKKIFKTLYYLLIPVIIFVLLGLAIEANKSVVCNSFVVNVDHSCGNYFIESEQIKSEVYKTFDTIGGGYFNKQQLKKVESLITGMTYVKNAEVYRTINGNVKANVTPRKPLARVFNKRGLSFYIDTDGKFMPLSRDFTARVIMVSGSINTQYSPVVDLNNLSDSELNEDDQKLMKDIYKITSYISNNKLLSAFIDHVYVTDEKNFELIPKNGSHIIEFGNIDNMEQKFHKLLVFYNHGLTKIGWNKYRRINLKYKNQIVCAK